MGRPTDQERIADETIIIHSSHEEWGWLTVVVGKYQHWLEEKWTWEKCGQEALLWFLWKEIDKAV